MAPEARAARCHCGTTVTEKNEAIRSSPKDVRLIFKIFSRCDFGSQPYLDILHMPVRLFLP